MGQQCTRAGKALPEDEIPLKGLVYEPVFTWAWESHLRTETLQVPIEGWAHKVREPASLPKPRVETCF